MYTNPRHSSDGRLWSSRRFCFHPRTVKHDLKNLEKLYTSEELPEWAKTDFSKYKENEKNEWWIEMVSSLEKLHKHTFRATIESGLSNLDPRIRWLTSEEIQFDSRLGYNIHTFLREIDLRGPSIKKEKLGRWKSPLNKNLSTTHPIKGAFTAKITCGGGGGGKK